MKLISISLLFFAIACQQSPDKSGETFSDNSADAQARDKGKLGPVDDVSQLNFSNNGFMAGPAQLLQGAWVSQCYPQNVLPHIPCIFHLQYYRMFYLFYPVDNSGNMLAQHYVREYNDPLCKDNFSGPFNPHTRQSIDVRGFYRISDQSNLFPNVIQVSFEWTQCSGACQNPQNPFDGVYLNQVKLGAFRESDDERQVLFWGANTPPRLGTSTPFMPDQWFQWNIPFYRLQFEASHTPVPPK